MRAPSSRLLPQPEIHPPLARSNGSGKALSSTSRRRRGGLFQDNVRTARNSRASSALFQPQFIHAVGHSGDSLKPASFNPKIRDRSYRNQCAFELLLTTESFSCAHQSSPSRTRRFHPCFRYARIERRKLVRHSPCEQSHRAARFLHISGV